MQRWFKRALILIAMLSSYPAFAESPQEAANLFQTFDASVAGLNDFAGRVIMFDVFFWTEEIRFPLAVFWLMCGALYFTVRTKFINVRALWHGIQVVRGKYAEESSQGDVTPWQALSSALSATVGLGNIAGVAIAVSLGGPGATFWMIMAGFLGMTSKFAESTLAQIYREIRPDGKVMGGAMEYLSRGLTELGYKRVGKGLATLFCLLCIGGSLGAGSAFQVNQSLKAVQEVIPFFGDNKWMYGLIMAVATAVVIIGGIKRIAHVAEVIVPFMCGSYVVACLFIIGMHLNQLPDLFYQIFSGAFSPQAIKGGMIGVLIVGFQRAAFSNEAGIGSAAIAHSAAKTKYPVREGFVSLLEPFIDTVIICTMTALVMVITGAWNNPEYAAIREAGNGAGLTSKAFGEHISWFPYILAMTVFLFAYSTMISWSYYGERCWAYLFGERTSILYKLILIVVIFFSATASATHILDFSDLMILGMAFPNMIGLFMLRAKIFSHLDAYWVRYKQGAFD